MNCKCIVCGKKLPQKSLFVLQNAPASAQDIPDALQVQKDEGVTLGLYQCAECGLVQFDCTPVSYYRDVIRAGGFSTTMTGLRRQQYQHLIETYHLEGKRFLEVGCGRGEFLKVLTEFPVQAYGMEHKEDLVEIARSEGLTVWNDFPETAKQVFSEGKGAPAVDKFDVFLSFNFLEHQPEPSVMLQAIYENLSEDGMGLVTVPALEYIVEKGSYYELIHDHIAYYSFRALRELLNRNGFAVLEEEMINRDTIAMIVKKIPRGQSNWQSTQESARESARGTTQNLKLGGTIGTPEYRDEEMIASLVHGYEKVQEDIDQLIAQLKEQGKRLAVWGASHQGFTLASTTALGTYAEYIIDSAPFKQGRFAPASHLPIVAPEKYHQNPVDVVLIVAPGYTEEIAGSIREKFGSKVQILAMRTDHVEHLEAR